MKKFKTIILLASFLIVATAINVAAQTRPHKTSSAKAYYGNAPKKQKFKMKKNHQVKKHKPSRATSAHAKHAAGYRRKSS